jgi:hypothetical protein
VFSMHFSRGFARRLECLNVCHAPSRRQIVIKPGTTTVRLKTIYDHHFNRNMVNQRYPPQPLPTMEEDALPLLYQKRPSKARTSISSTVIVAFLVVLLWMGVRNEYSPNLASSSVVQDSPVVGESAVVDANKRELRPHNDPFPFW